MIAVTDPSTVMIETIAIMILAVAGLLFLLGIYYVLDRLFLFSCQHNHVRCIHGDEVIQAKFRRVRCEDCGRALDRSLPAVCTVTGTPHVAPPEVTP